MGVVVLLWAGMMLRTLSVLRERAAQRTGDDTPPMGEALREAGPWLKDPEYRSERKTLLFLSVALLVMVATQAFVQEG
ncbi:hypothetical protein roselon_00792 [Roseibacterium elongatum DSM 19469]|uniref:Uncharacterized protein n=2 Tax=Roseicyclus elongatus TaxID=159346 RepID=W8RQ67_9RHOB|nr:hypothetical protein roselon_00792 [Roseibacterium elongatum DSM 19469]